MLITTKAPASWHVYLTIFISILSVALTLKMLFSNIQTAKGSNYLIQIDNSDKTTGNETVSYKRTSQPDSTFLKGSYVNAKPYASARLVFNNNPAFLVWMCCIALMVAVASSSIPILLFSIGELFQNFTPTILTVAKEAMVTAIILLGVYKLNNDSEFLITTVDVIRDFHILLKSAGIIQGIVTYTLLVAMLAVFGQLVINESINQLPLSIKSLEVGEVEKVAQKFNLLKEKLKLFLVISSILIVFAIVTSQLLRDAILAEVKASFDIVPISFVYIYGLVFTFFLAILYLPIYYRLKRKGELMSQLKENDLAEKGVEKFAGLFLIKENPFESFKLTVTILAPILSSLIPNLKLL